MNLRREIESRGISITDFAEMIGVTRLTIYHWFDPKRRAKSRIAEMLISKGFAELDATKNSDNKKKKGGNNV